MGTLTGGRVPAADRGLLAVEYADLGSAERIPSGPYDAELVEQTNAELELICDELRGLGVTVRRP
jgi:glycine amidinotransferase/scyllo-inosamine-4-phosphate amidinotransferase 1